MLRKTLCLIAALALAFSAFALADDLEITQEAFYVTPTLTYYSGQIFGEITNTSDHPMRITDMLYELYDADGSSIASGTIYMIRPRCIAPGQRAWFAVSGSVKDAAEPEAIAGYSVTVAGKPADEADLLRSVSDVELSDNTGLIEGKHFGCVVTNDTEETLGNLVAMFALYGEDGALLYAVETSTVGLGLTPGSSGLVTVPFDSSVLKSLIAGGVGFGQIEVAVTDW